MQFLHQICCGHRQFVTRKGSSSTPSSPAVTLPETNIAPENDPLEKENPIGNRHFLGAMLVLGRVT